MRYTIGPLHEFTPGMHENIWGIKYCLLIFVKENQFASNMISCGNIAHDCWNSPCTKKEGTCLKSISYNFNTGPLCWESNGDWNRICDHVMMSQPCHDVTTMSWCHSHVMMSQPCHDVTAMSWCHNHVMMSQPCHDVTAMSWCHNHVKMSQPCQDVTTMSWCHNHVMMSQPCHDVTIMSWCHNHVMMSQSCHDVTTMSWCHNHVMMSQPCQDVTTMPWCHNHVMMSQPCHDVTTMSWCHNHVMMSQPCHDVTMTSKEVYTVFVEIWHREFITLQIARFMGPTWSPPGSCLPQLGPMLAPWTLLSGTVLMLKVISEEFFLMLIYMVLWYPRLYISQLGIGQ